MQVDIGLLAACFKVPGQGYASCYCTIQLYEEMDSFGSGFFNEYDCPLYKRQIHFAVYLLIQSVKLCLSCMSALPFVCLKL